MQLGKILKKTTFKQFLVTKYVKESIDLIEIMLVENFKVCCKAFFKKNRFEEY